MMTAIAITSPARHYIGHASCPCKVGGRQHAARAIELGLMIARQEQHLTLTS